MARVGVYREDSSRLEVRRSGDGALLEAYITPYTTPPEGSQAAARLEEGVLLVTLERSTGTVKIHPINTRENHPGYLGPKYEKIRTLTLTMGAEVTENTSEEQDINALLELLPAGFVKDFDYGLGLLQDCNRLVGLIEGATHCDEIVFSDAHHDGVVIEENKLLLGTARFDAIWTEIQRINSRGNAAKARVKDAFVHNNLAEALNLSEVELSLGRLQTSRFIAKAANGVEELNQTERNALIDALKAESSKVAEDQPEKFKQFHRDIEVVSLARLINSFETALNESHPERFWQEFFEANGFALQQVFGAPMVGVQSGATVGGGGLHGAGDRIADYVLKHSITNNLALVEIKTPATRLLNAGKYRNGVYAPSTEIVGAITQVLDQAHQLNQNLPVLKSNSRRWDLESYAISCFVVAGRMSSIVEEVKQKSFELYRANSRNVSIVTYDEILEQLKALRDFLAAPSGGQRATVAATESEAM